MSIKAVIFRIAMIIFAAELLIMLALAKVHHEMDLYFEALVDGVALVVLSAPAIFLWVISPFIDARDEAIAQVNRLANADPLTKLANRRLISKHLEEAVAVNVRHKDHGAALLIDLDEFKPINDVYGHETGDAVLVEVANRLRSVCRAEDIVGRLGGDEFIVLIHRLGVDQVAARQKAMQMAERLTRSIRSPIDCNGKQFQIGASIGIRLIAGEDQDSETAIREADLAMYRAKQSGKGCYAFFEQEAEGS